MELSWIAPRFLRIGSVEGLSRESFFFICVIMHSHFGPSLFPDRYHFLSLLGDATRGSPYTLVIYALCKLNLLRSLHGNHCCLREKRA